MNIRLAVLVSSLALAGCAEEFTASSELYVGSAADPVVIDSSCDGALADDPMTIQALAMEGDLLRAVVRYSGGCEGHVFGMCWDGLLAVTDPVEVTLEPRHDSRGDRCEAHITRDVFIDLSALEEGYKSVLGPSGTIVIHVSGASQSATHAF